MALARKIRGYTHQQYIVTLGHQAVLLHALASVAARHWQPP